MATPATQRAPRRRARRGAASSRSTRSPRAAAGSRAPNGYVVFVSGALPGRPGPGPADEGEARLRRGAGRRAARPERRPGRRPLRPRRRALPRRALAGAALRAPARREARAGRRRAAPPRRPRRLRARADRARGRAWRYRNKLEYSFGERDGEPGARLPPPRQLGRGRRRRGLPARLGGATTRPATWSATGRGARGSPPTTARRQTGVLRNLVVREGRRTGQLQTRLVTSPAELPQAAGRPAHGGRGARRRHRRADRRARRGVPRRGARRPALPSLPRAPSSRPTPRWPSASTRSPPSYAGLAGQRARLRPLLRDRHDRPRARARRRRGLGPRDRPRGGRRRRAQRARATGSTTPASSPPTRASAFGRCSSRPAGPTWSSSTRPAPASRKKIVRRVLECEAPRIVYVSCNPTTLAPNAAQLVEAGYRLRRVRPVDMFPQTPHVECVALLGASERMTRAASESPPGSTRRSRAPLAARCAELGYASMWSNDHPGGQRARDAGGLRRAAPAARARASR